MNGAISFGQPLSSRQAHPFPQPVPIITPFSNDIDLVCEDGDVLYRQTTSTSIRAKVVSDIQSHLSLQNAFDPTLVVIATWNEINYSGANYYPSTNNPSCGDKVNTTQNFPQMKVFNSCMCMGSSWCKVVVQMYNDSC